MLKFILILVALFSFAMTMIIYKKLKELKYGMVEHFSMGTVLFLLIVFALIFGILIKLTDAMFITIF